MKLNKIKCSVIVLLWLVIDAVRDCFRHNEFMNLVGQRGSWITLPQMYERHKIQDEQLLKIRKRWLQENYSDK